VRHARVTCIAALLAFATLTTTSRDAAAAKEVGLGAAYDARVPIGGLRRLLPNTSFGGLQARWDFYPLDGLSTGIAVQYNLFQRDTATETLPLDNGAITATTFRYASIWSFIPTVRYYLFPRGALRPYGELGAGVTAVTSAVLISDLPQRELSTGFVIQPSAGVLWRLTSLRTSHVLDGADGDEEGSSSPRKPLESMFGLTASVTYAFTTADVFGASDISHAGIQIGIYAKP
jgi:hypothetical protein